MSMTENYHRLMEQVEDLRRRWRTLYVGEGLVRVGVALAAAVILVVAADNLLWPDRGGRWLLFGLLLATPVLGLLAWVARRSLEDRRDDFFAALVEEKYPVLHNRLINGLQLGRGNEQGSPRLIEAIVEDAVRAAADINLSGALDRKPLRRTALVLGAVSLVLVGYACTDRFGNGFSRVLAPLSDIAPWTATRVAEVKPGNRKLLAGLPVPIEARVVGDLPDLAQVFVRSESKPWRPLTMRALPAKKAADGSQQFGFTVREASQSFDYYVLAGDGRSSQYRVDVVERPRIEAISLELTPPAYAHQPVVKRPDSDGQVDGLCGTQVKLSLRASKPLKSAILLLEPGEPLTLSRGKDDRTWDTNVVIWSQGASADVSLHGRLVEADARYQVRLAATDGSDLTDPLWRSISLVPDLPPTVAIAAPGRDLQVSPEENLSLEVVAKDDFGVGPVKLLYRVNEETQVRELAAWPTEGAPQTSAAQKHAWNLASGGFKAGDVVQYWAEVADRNHLTGPGVAKSQTYSVFIKSPEEALARLDLQLDDYVQVLEELVRLQSENRAQTAAAVAYETLVVRETLIRTRTLQMTRAMQRDAAPLASMIEALDDLYAGLMADCIRLLEAGRDAADPARATTLRSESLPVQDEIIARLRELLERLQRNDQAREALKKLAKADKAGHTAIVDALAGIVRDLDRLLAEETELEGKFEKLPKKSVEEANEEAMEAMRDLEEFEEKWNEWAKGTVDELTKLPAGFVDDFGLREDVNRIFEEIEKAANRAKSTKLEVALEDLGAGMATKMLEDLEMWMMDSPDALQWVLEEPLDKGPLQVPEMPLPDALEDLVGDLLQEAEEFDEEADDITSAWGDNLNQAGWGVSDGPISSFSAKGKTGNDLPNNMEVSGRSGDGRRGKSSGQMVGDTSRGLQGRKTPARVGAERYEPGQLKEENHQDPNGVTGGGKKSGSGRRGLQGGTPPDFVKDMQRLSERQAGLREKAEQVAQRLETAGVNSTRLNDSIELMRAAEEDLRDLRYEDAANRRRVALGQLKSALSGPDRATAAQLSRAHELPAEMREELLQSTDEGYPEGYEALLKSYFRALSEAER